MRKCEAQLLKNCRKQLEIQNPAVLNQLLQAKFKKKKPQSDSTVQTVEEMLPAIHNFPQIDKFRHSHQPHNLIPSL